ncbi:MAG: GNAT family N-acetyltransferase [Cytophagales bacterium]|nr:GNAT family N-acetyltransferase [Cytophagales bacterium]
MRIYQRHEIDDAKWDLCIRKSTNLFYPYSWYLDCVASNWIAIIVEDKDQYQSVFPLCVHKKWSLPYVYHPFFTQQLGYFSLNPSSQELEKMLNKAKSKFLSFTLNLSIENTELAQSTIIAHKVNSNFLLSLNSDYEILYKAYSTNQKRNIKKAKKNDLLIEETNDIDWLIKTFQENKGAEIEILKSHHYEYLRSIFEQSSQREVSTIYWVKNQKQIPVAGALFLINSQKITFLFGTSNEDGKKSRAMSLLIDHMIQKYAQRNMILDFEGSNIESIARFYKSFGAKPQNYLTIKDQKVNRLLQLKQKFSSL